MDDEDVKRLQKSYEADLDHVTAQRDEAVAQVEAVRWLLRELLLLLIRRM